MASLVANRCLTVPQLVSTAGASASTFRASNKPGGAHDARLRLTQQKDLALNQPAQLAKVLGILERIRPECNDAQHGGR